MGWPRAVSEGRFAAAESELKSLVSGQLARGASAALTLYELARLYALSGRPAECRRLAEALLPAASPAGRYCLLALLGRPREAFAEGERVLRRGPSPAELDLLLHPWGRLHDGRATERWLAARVPALERLPASPWRSLWLCVAAARLERWKEAARRLGELRAAPARRWGWMLALNNTHRYGGDWLADMLRADSGPALPWKARARLAEALVCARRTAEGLAQMRRARRDAPPEMLPDLGAWEGLLLLMAGRPRRALAALRPARDAGAPFAGCWLAGALVLLGRPREALAALELAHARLPRDAEAWVWHAEALDLLGRRKEAAAARRRARRLGERVWTALGDARAALGRGRVLEAKRAFELLPRQAAEPLARRAGWKSRHPEDAASLAEAVRGAYARARGNRREDSHALRMWL